MSRELGRTTFAEDVNGAPIPDLKNHSEGLGLTLSKAGSQGGHGVDKMQFIFLKKLLWLLSDI